MLLSNSTNFGGGYLDHAMPDILAFFGAIRRLLFVPFAGSDRALYTEKVRARFAREGIEVDGLIALTGGSDGSRRPRPSSSEAATPFA